MYSTGGGCGSSMTACWAGVKAGRKTDGRNVRGWASKGFTLFKFGWQPLSIPAVIGVCATGFLHHLGLSFIMVDRLAQAEGMCGKAYVNWRGLLERCRGLYVSCPDSYPKLLAYYYVQAKTPKSILL